MHYRFNELFKEYCIFMSLGNVLFTHTGIVLSYNNKELLFAHLGFEFSQWNLALDVVCVQLEYILVLSISER